MVSEKSRRANRFDGRAFLLFIMGVAAGRAVLDLRVDHRLATIFRTLEQEGLPTCPRQLAPDPLSPDENAAPLFTAAYAVGVELHSFIGEEVNDDLDPDLKAELDLLLARNGKAFELIRLARTMKGCRFNRDFSCNRLEVPMPEAPDLLAASAALDYKARREAEQDRHEEARETVKDMLGLADAYRDEPLYLPQHLRRTILERAARTAAWCSHRTTNSCDLSPWLDVLPDGRALDDSAARGMRGDLACGACRLVQPNPLSPFLGDDWMTRTMGRFLSPLYRSCSIDSFGQYAESVRRCSAGVSRISDLPEISRGVAFDIGTLCAGSPSQALKSQWFAQAVLAVTRAGLEAEIHFLREGSWPERLSGTDPFTGKSLFYDLGQGTVSSAGPPDQPPETLEADGLLWRLRGR